jgi:exosortase A-associated hydrolase 2
LKPRVSGHFIAGGGGPLAVVLVEPPLGVESRFTVLYLPPSGDELNRSRRMVALQARAFAAIGGTVALLDPRGTGDSAGDHGDATWQGWRDDAAVAWSWLQLRGPGPRLLWGLRLGGLLAADLASSAVIAAANLILWQPVLDGRIHVQQWLRLATTQQMTGGSGAGADSRSLRQSLAAGRPVEVGGYELHPDLVAQAEAVEMRTLRLRDRRIVWREVSNAVPPAIGIATVRTKNALHSDGAQIDIAAVNGPPFWMSQEIMEAPALIDATTEAVASIAARCEHASP